MYKQCVGMLNAKIDGRWLIQKVEVVDCGFFGFQTLLYAKCLRQNFVWKLNVTTVLRVPAGSSSLMQVRMKELGNNNRTI